MDSLIRKANFLHNDEAKREQFDDTVREWLSDNEEKCTAKDLPKALSALADKVTEKEFPHIHTEGWEQATIAFGHIRDTFSELVSKDKGLQKDCFDFVLRLLKYGPGTIHMNLITSCINDLELADYIKSLSGEKLTQVIQALTTDVKPKEKVTEEELYDIHSDFIQLFMDDVFSKDQLHAHIKILLDYFIHLSLDFGHLEERPCELLAETGQHIYNALGDPWENFKDITSIKTYIKHFGETFKKPNAFRTEAAERIAQGTMCNLTETLGAKGKVKEFYQEMIDLALNVSKYPGKKDEFAIRAFKDVIAFFTSLPSNAITKDPVLFKQVAQKYSTAIENLELKFLMRTRFAVDLLDDFLLSLYGKDKQSTKEWVELMIPLFKRSCVNTLRACENILNEGSAIKWTEYPEVAKKVFDAINTIKIPEADDDDEKGDKQVQDFIKLLSNITNMFIEGLKKSKMLKNYSGAMLKLAITLIEMKDENLFDMAMDIADKIDITPKDNKAIVVEVMMRVNSVVQMEDYLWNEKYTIHRTLEHIIYCCTRPFKDAKVFTDAELKIYVAVCVNCLQHEAVNPEDGETLSAFYSIFIAVMDSLSQWLLAMNRFDLAAGMVPGIMKTFEEDNEQVVMLNCRFLGDFAQVTSGQKILAPHLEKLILIYLDKDQAQPDLLRLLDAIYPYNTKAFTKHYKELFKILLESGDMQATMWLCQLFHKVSKTHPELFTDKDTEMLIKKAKQDVTNQPTLLQILQELCKRQPKAMVKNIDLLLDTSGWNPMLLSWMHDMYCSVALYDKSVAPKVQTHLLKSVKSNHDKANLLTGLNSLRMIGFKYPEIIKPKRAEIEGLKMMDPDGQNLQRTILDMIDGKTPENLRKELEAQQSNLTDLVGRVEETEEQVANINTELDRQGAELDNVKNDVNEHGQRLDQVEETVDETVLKVEEIDQKTLSHAPYWSRDVSKLLNPQSEHDWRLLASRLGYSNDDIRGWAQQADPCMAMLNEWYATHKTSEATFAILTQLQEMNRMDAAVIVENAMKNADAVVEDEDFEYASPPSIFISYQWGHQPEVKLLKQHLEMAGYDSWLDIGQMGGGDKLFEKIDNGIRAAKIVISCVTEKYAKSPNCNREVNLSVSLNKAVIPLLLEKCTWPPPGSMGPIFSEYLFIRFYQRAGEELDDERYWPKDKFQELLMQLNMFGLPPDEGKTEPIYRNWWMPVVEEIKIDKSKTKDGGQVSASKVSEIEEKAAVSPDVFISYQWGKQKNIIKLYERLTSFGLSCWLDIKQMGGGDSLYDKIDRGVRGSKVVVSGFTAKYALSANCRREVSLADALKKPIIPLLLEKMTWPPSGPMSMVMTQLLYIDFTKNESEQTTWDGPMSQQLLDKIYGHVPKPVTQEPRGEKKQNDENREKQTMRQNEEETTVKILRKATRGKPQTEPDHQKEKPHWVEHEKKEKVRHEEKLSETVRDEEKLREQQERQILKEKEMQRLREQHRLREEQLLIEEEKRIKEQQKKKEELRSYEKQERQTEEQLWKDARRQREEQKKRDEEMKHSYLKDEHYGSPDDVDESQEVEKLFSKENGIHDVDESQEAEKEPFSKDNGNYGSHYDVDENQAVDKETFDKKNGNYGSYNDVSEIQELDKEPLDNENGNNGLNDDVDETQDVQKESFNKEEGSRKKHNAHVSFEPGIPEDGSDSGGNVLDTFSSNHMVLPLDDDLQQSEKPVKPQISKTRPSVAKTPVKKSPRPPPSQQAKLPHYKFHRPPPQQQTRLHPSEQSPQVKSPQTKSPKSTSSQKTGASSYSPKPPPSQQTRTSGDRVPSQAFKSGERPRPAPVTRNVAPAASKPVPNNQENSNPPPTEKTGPATPRKEQQVSSPGREKPQAQEPPKPAPSQTGNKSKSCTVI